MLLMRKGGGNVMNKHLRTLLEASIGFLLGVSVTFLVVFEMDSVRLKPASAAKHEHSCSVQTDAKPPTTVVSPGNADVVLQNAVGIPTKKDFNGNGDLLQLSTDIRSLLERGDSMENRQSDRKLLDRMKAFETTLDRLTNSTTALLRSPKTEGETTRAIAEDGKLHKQDDYTVADSLYKKVRVLCWVMTQPANLETRARHVKNTWGKRCHKLLFFSSVANETFPTIALNNTYEDRSQLNRKTIRAFQYVHDHYWNDFDWFMRTDDDAYVIMENLRYFLSEQDPDGVYYFGHHFKTLVPGGYFSGGPGIVLGREALKRYAVASRNSSLCYQGDTFADDAELGKCLHQVGIKPGNSTDRLGRSRFHCFDPGTHVMKFYPDWFYAYDANGAHGGRESMSDYAIGFHYVNDVKINELEYYVYHLRPYGVKFADQDLNWSQKQRK